MSDALMADVSMQQPPVQRRGGLTYADEAAAVADVTNLRRGYTQVGNWSLEQTCWHLATVIENLTQPPDALAAPQTAEQLEKLNWVLANGRLPGRIDAPPHITPPADAGEDSINRYVQAMTRAATYAGKWKPHRVFGPMASADFRRLNLVHAAHHFANLVPRS